MRRFSPEAAGSLQTHRFERQHGRLNPSTMNYQQQMRSALRLHQQGRREQAKKIYQALLTQWPDDPQVNHFLGLLHQQLGDHATALPLLRKAANDLPREAQAQSVLAVSLLETGLLDEAIAHLRLALQANPDYAPAHNSLGMALKQRGDLAAAIASYETAARLKPDAVQIHNNLGNALAEAGELERAVASYREAIKRQPGHAEARLNLVVTLALAGDASASKAECARLLELQPDNALAHNYMGNACNALGEQDQALEHYRRAAELDPTLAEAHFYLAMISNNAEAVDAAAVLEQFENPETDPADKILLGFTLGRIHEVREDWEQSFDFYRQANRLKADSVRVSTGETRALFARIKSVFNPEFMVRHRAPSTAGERMIFVLGMPRSGTSLAEQILASHSQVTGAGELKHLGDVAREMAADSGGAFPDCVQQLAAEDISEYAQSYLSRIAPLAGEGQRIVDKMPQNFHYIGLIALLLPEARIIHCRRDPMATCFSLYKTLFTFGQDYSYDLSNLGRYYRLYADLMAHWEELLPGRILHLDYEALTTDTENEIRRMLDYCNLEFEPECLDFHKTRRAVATASAAQVRKPIYRDSIARWKHYAPYLKPLEAALHSD
jgi:tetratricopeptide (TPR) repeat protein